MSLSADSGLRRVDTLSVEDRSVEGTQIEVYSASDVPQRIVVTDFGESGISIKTYVFDQGRLVCSLSDDQRYDNQFSGRNVQRSHLRFVYDDGVLVGSERSDSGTIGRPTPQDVAMSQSFLKADADSVWRIVIAHRKAR